MPTLAPLLGHSKLSMVMRYAHPQERHQADAVKRLEKVTAARQNAEFEKKEKPNQESPATISTTVSENPAIFSESKNRR